MNKRESVYKLVCENCGHMQIDNILWKDCLRMGCNGKYKIVFEYKV